MGLLNRTLYKLQGLFIKIYLFIFTVVCEMCGTTGNISTFFSKTKRFCSISCSRSYSSNSKKTSILARLQVSTQQTKLHDECVCILCMCPFSHVEDVTFWSEALYTYPLVFDFMILQSLIQFTCLLYFSPKCFPKAEVCTLLHNTHHNTNHYFLILRRFAEHTPVFAATHSLIKHTKRWTVQ